ncbi:hypothetical protein BIY29_10030 [Brenneria alni]|uniref:Uncharacterized protein n=1 Tax=Brenneria alni TaxID=71656 RepID=A0A421DNJ8_9GAMM|nr:hypothetical protein [Brenneria alni]RLM23631.1 hypothetical protein BIY29_10030 [Brenneria alni]
MSATIVNTRNDLYGLTTQKLTLRKSMDERALSLIEATSDLCVTAYHERNGTDTAVSLAERMATVEILIEQYRFAGMDTLIEVAKQRQLQALAEKLGVEYVE